MTERKTHLRIDFVVQEVLDEGESGTDDLRYIRFGDDVPIPNVRDFFDRCASAMSLMFKQGHAVLCLESSGANKIAVIKVVRELTGFGLKEAKDVVESPPGVAVLTTEDHYSLQFAIKQLNEAGAKVEVRSGTIATHRRIASNGTPLPPVPVYSRPM